jgi:hypothetical protein
MFADPGGVDPDVLTQSKDKARKWLHAISIEALAYMSRDALTEEPPECTDTPYAAFVPKGSRTAPPSEGGERPLPNQAIGACRGRL